jgi:hypothetical protein
LTLLATVPVLRGDFDKSNEVQNRDLNIARRPEGALRWGANALEIARNQLTLSLDPSTVQTTGKFDLSVGTPETLPSASLIFGATLDPMSNETAILYRKNNDYTCYLARLRDYNMGADRTFGSVNSSGIPEGVSLPYFSQYPQQSCDRVFSVAGAFFVTSKSSANFIGSKIVKIGLDGTIVTSGVLAAGSGASDSLVTSNGKLVVLARSMAFLGSNSEILIERWNLDSMTLDGTFGTGGKQSIVTPLFQWGAMPSSSVGINKLVPFSGGFYSIIDAYNGTYVMKFLEQGNQYVIDTSFGNGGAATPQTAYGFGAIRDMILSEDGGILWAGVYRNASNLWQPFVQKLLPNASLDQSFNNSGTLNLSAFPESTQSNLRVYLIKNADDKYITCSDFNYSYGKGVSCTKFDNQGGIVLGEGAFGSGDGVAKYDYVAPGITSIYLRGLKLRNDGRIFFYGNTNNDLMTGGILP